MTKKLTINLPDSSAKSLEWICEIRGVVFATMAASLLVRAIEKDYENLLKLKQLESDVLRGEDDGSITG